MGKNEGVGWEIGIMMSEMSAMLTDRLRNIYNVSVGEPRKFIGSDRF
jgi:hypothetical protein